MTIPCEGRCGVRLHSDMTEKTPDGPRAPRHTIVRCRGYRRLRDTLTERLPDAEVDLWPSSTLPAIVARVTARTFDGQRFTVVRAFGDILHEKEVWYAYRYEADRIARTLIESVAVTV